MNKKRSDLVASITGIFAYFLLHHVLRFNWWISIVTGIVIGALIALSWEWLQHTLRARHRHGSSAASQISKRDRGFSFTDEANAPDLPELLPLLIDLEAQRANSDDVIAWAAMALEKGLDSPTLRILAGLQTGSSGLEVERYFRQSLEELGWKQPNFKQAIANRAKRVAADILSGQVDSEKGADEVYAISQALDYPSELARWGCLKGGKDSCVGQGATGENISLTDAIMREAQKLVGEPS